MERLKCPKIQVIGEQSSVAYETNWKSAYTKQIAHLIHLVPQGRENN